MLLRKRTESEQFLVWHTAQPGRVTKLEDVPLPEQGLKTRATMMLSKVTLIFSSDGSIACHIVAVKKITKISGKWDCRSLP